MSASSASRGRTVAATSQSRRHRARFFLALFVLLVIVVYALIFFTGDRQAATKLGIDLQGGTRITLVPQGEEPTQDQLQQARTIMEQRVNGMGVSDAEVVIDGNTLVITVAGEDTSQARMVGQTSQLLFRPVAHPEAPDVAKLSSTLQEMANRWVEYRVLSPEQATEKTKTYVDQANQALAQMPGQQKLTAPKISATPRPEPKNSLEIAKQRRETTQMLGKDRQSTDPTVQEAARALLVCDESTDQLAGTDDPAKPLVTCDQASGQAYLLDPAPLLEGQPGKEGQRLTGASINTDRPINGGMNPDTGQMEITFSFKSDNGETGGQTWAKLTQEYLHQQVAITLDSKVISAPQIQSATPVGAVTSITGDFSQQEAQDLANNLRYGALPLSFAGPDGEAGGTVVTVPASLGTASLKAGLVAGVVGLILVAIFVFAYYRLFGVFALLSLAASGAVIYGVLVLLGRWIGYSLDLSGVAGLIIGIGTTADSFIVLYERIKDEVRNGRTFRSAVPRGWDSARRTIITGNMVTFIAAVAIYFLAIGEVKGFAFTLGLTTIFDIAVTFLVTAPLILLTSRRPFWAKPSVNGMGHAFAHAAEESRRASTAEVEAASEEPSAAHETEEK
ncbi:protein translocase subunit SecD [Corynebacterium uropygiale]|uniref:protein translocase subunit SecD n=1 Tax=Corynebacterium uropygiale TaxID=1775911 RepID=UPI0022A700E8|nr:protein translocase subunit SecD [Corynebacterium uropygiale]